MRKNRHDLKKEKFVMLASSLLVLSALTLTGVYVKERTRIQNENSAELSRGEETEETTQENSSPVNVGTAVNPNVKEDALEGEYGSYQEHLAVFPIDGLGRIGHLEVIDHGIPFILKFCSGIFLNKNPTA